MITTSSIEFVEASFMPVFEIVKKQNLNIEGLAVLSLTGKILLSASDFYGEAVANEQADSQTLSQTFTLFSNTYQSIAS